MHSNAALLAQLASEPEFVAGKVDTGFIERHAGKLLAAPEPDGALVAAAASALLAAGPDDPWSALIGWRGSAPDFRQMPVEINGKVYHTEPQESVPGARVFVIEGDLILFGGGTPWRCRTPVVARDASAREHADGAMLSPMPGRIVSVATESGATVKRGQRLVVLEAMKMEHAIAAPFDGVVSELPVSEGDQVTEGTMLVRVRKEAT